jgi:hypothetical protein
MQHNTAVLIHGMDHTFQHDEFLTFKKYLGFIPCTVVRDDKKRVEYASVQNCDFDSSWNYLFQAGPTPDMKKTIQEIISRFSDLAKRWMDKEREDDEKEPR